MIRLLDLVLVIFLPLLGWRMLASENLFRAVVLYICFGLLMALTWVRLAAPDVALAEAAIGAGLTGALFLSALRRMERGVRGERRLDREEKRQKGPSGKKGEGRRAGEVVYGAALVFLAGFALLLAAALAANPGVQHTTAALIDQLMGRSGVESRVTAVLLNIRGYDTLLEVMVLLLAVIGVWSLARFSPLMPEAAESDVLQTLVRLLVPLMVIVAGYLVWNGGVRAGGAFQGGAVLAAAGVLLLLADRAKMMAPAKKGLLRFSIVLGPLVFLLAAFSAMLHDGSVLEYPQGHAGGWIVFLESAAAISIGVTLAALYGGGRPLSGSEGLNDEDEQLDSDDEGGAA